MTTILTRMDEDASGRAGALKQEFAALAQRTPDVLAFLLRYPADPKEPIRTEPSFGPPLLALGRSYSAYIRRVPFNAKNLKRYAQGELLKGKERELFEPPKPVGFLPLSPSSGGCLYFYGDAEGHRHFASVAEDASVLTGRPFSPWTWYEFLFDWALRTGCIRWITSGGHIFTKALNLPRESVQAIGSLSDELDGDNQARDVQASAAASKRIRLAMESLRWVEEQHPELTRCEWNPPPGFVGRKAVCNHERFKKRGKNPSATTIDGWVKSAKRQDAPIDIHKDPSNSENYYPEAWIMNRIAVWNPRTPKT